MSHDAGVMIQQFWVGGVDDKGYEETNAGCYEDVGVKPRKKKKKVHICIFCVSFCLFYKFCPFCKFHLFVYLSVCFVYFIYCQTCVQRPPLAPEKCGRVD